MEYDLQRCAAGRRLGVMLLLLGVSCFSAVAGETSLQFLEFGSSQAILSGSVPRGSNTNSDPILVNLSGGFPFSNGSESVIYVSVNGYLSFRTSRDHCCPYPFNSTSSYSHTIAPYWINNDISTAGEVVYEVHENGSQLELISATVSEEVGVAFEGVWMLVVFWNDVPSSQDNQRNSYQAVLVTDGIRSYALFLYRCGHLHTTQAGIGYRASGNFFENHPLANSATSHTIACSNRPHTSWTVVIYPIHYAGVRAVVRSYPEGPVFHAAQYIDLRCYVITPGSYTFTWVSYCTGSGADVVVSSHGGFTDSSAVLSVRSTPDTCLDVVACRATDDLGSGTEGRFSITNVTGVGMFHWLNSFANNTGLEADSQHQIGPVSCHSASRQPHIGRWISPHGDDITFSDDDIFSVEFHSGNFPSYSVLSLQPGAAFTSDHQGVYSCVIPDENGVERTVYFGLYDSGYHSIPSNYNPLTIQRSSEHPFTLTCSSTFLPPYLLLWQRGNEVISNGDTYSLSSNLADRLTSTYENTLTISTESGVGLTGVIYLCGMRMQVQPYHQTDEPDFIAFTYYTRAVVNELGTRRSVTCTAFNNPAFTVWTTGGSEVARAVGNMAVLELNPVSDSHHNEEYICLGLSSAGSEVYRLSITVVVHVPSTALTVSVSEQATPQLGQPYTLRCLASKADGLASHATAVWSHDLSHDSGSGVTAGEENVSSPKLTFRDLCFPELRTSHAGRYVCTGGLTSDALDEPLTRMEEYNLILTVPMATVTLTAPTTVSPFRAGSDITLTCTATLPTTVDTEVTGVVTWDTPHGILNESSGRLTLSTLQSGSHTHLFRLHISPLSHLSDEGGYSCSVTFHPDPPTSYLSPSTLPATSNTIHITLNGATLYHTSHGYLLNNSLISATEDGTIGTVQCISDSTHPVTERWITPSAATSGALNISSEAGLIELGLVDGAVFTPGLEGVYTCVIDDDSGGVHVLSVGIYPHGFSGAVAITELSVRRESSLFTVECITSSSPPSLLLWRKDGVPLELASSELTFSQTQEVTDRGDSMYSSLLVVEGPVALVTGTYICSAENDYGSSTEELLVTGIDIQADGEVFILGQSASLTCASDLHVVSIEWSTPAGSRVPSEPVAADGASQLEFATVSEDLNGRVYVCRVTTPYGCLETEHRVMVRANPADFLLAVTSSLDEEIVGRNYTLSCSFSTPDGTEGAPEVEWVDEDGEDVAETTDIVITRSKLNGGRVLNVMVTFQSLSHDHMGQYTCNATVNVAVPPFQITKSQTTTIDPEDLPFLPQGLVTISITPDSATIQWEAGDNQYLVSVVEYTVEYGETDRLEAGTTAAVVLGPDSDVGSADLRGLLPATRYYYSVVASTAVGEKRSPLKTFQTKEDVTVTSSPQEQNNNAVIGAVVAIMVVVIVVIVITAAVIFLTVRRKPNTQIYNMNGSHRDPSYHHPPPPYTTSPSFLPSTTNTHHYPDTQLHTNQLHTNGSEYAAIGNGTYSQMSVSDNCAYDPVAPPLPPARNSTHELIQPYAETSAYVKTDPSLLNTVEKLEGQSSHRLETANPLYAVADNVEPVYSKVGAVYSELGAVETGGEETMEEVSYHTPNQL